MRNIFAISASGAFILGMFQQSTGHNIIKLDGKPFFGRNMEKIKKGNGIALKVPFKAGAWYTASTVITKGISLISTPIFTRLMSEADYAVFPLYLSRMGIVSAIAGIEAVGTALLVGIQKYKNRDTLLRSAIVLQSAIISLVCILYFAFYALFRNFLVINKQISLLMFFQIIFDGITGIVILRWRYEYRYFPVFITNVITSLASAALSVLLVQKLSLGGEGRIIGLVTVSAISTAVLLLEYIPKGKTADRGMIEYLIKRALPLIPQGLGVALLAGADRLMILSSFGAESLAKYSVAHSVGVAVCFISSALLMAIRPWVLRRLNAGEEARISEAVDTCTPLLCVAVIAVVCIAPEAMRLLAPNSYSEANAAIIPTALSVLPAFLSSITATAAVYHGKSMSALIPVISGVLVNVLLNFTFFSFLPYTSAALSSLISNLISFLIWSAIYRKISKRKIYSFKKCSILFTASLALAYGIYLLSELSLLRMIILALVVSIPIPLYKNALRLVREAR